MCPCGRFLHCNARLWAKAIFECQPDASWCTWLSYLSLQTGKSLWLHCRPPSMLFADERLSSLPAHHQRLLRSTSAWKFSSSTRRWMPSPKRESVSGQHFRRSLSLQRYQCASTLLTLPINKDQSYWRYLGWAIEWAKHHNETRVLLPDHLPELLNCAFHWGLSRDKGLVAVTFY